MQTTSANDLAAAQTDFDAAERLYAYELRFGTPEESDFALRHLADCRSRLNLLDGTAEALASQAADEDEARESAPVRVSALDAIPEGGSIPRLPKSSVLPRWQTDLMAEESAIVAAAKRQDELTCRKPGCDKTRLTTRLMGVTHCPVHATAGEWHIAQPPRTVKSPRAPRLTAEQRAEAASLVEDGGYTRAEAVAWVRVFPSARKAG